MNGGDDELLGTLRELWPNTLVLNRAGTDIATRVKDAGIGTATVVVPGGQHSYVYGAGRVPEADAAIARIGAWVREKTKT